MLLITILVIWLQVAMVTAYSHDKVAYHHILSSAMESHIQRPQVWLSPEVLLPGDGLNTYIKAVQNDQEMFFMLASTNYNVSEQCMAGMRHYFDGLTSNKFWAIGMLDAMGKLPSGIALGDFIWPGQYDQCINTSAVLQDINSPTNVTLMRGKYFRLSLNISSGLNGLNDSPLAATGIKGLTIGICVPSNCSKHDVEGMVNAVFYIVKPLLPTNSSLHNKTSLLYDKTGVQDSTVTFESRPETIVAILFSCFIGFFVIFGTLYDVFIYQSSLHESRDEPAVIPEMENDLGVSTNMADTTRLFADGKNVTYVTIMHKLNNIGIFGKILLSFSMYTNGSKVLNTEPTSNQIQAVNGVRVLSMGWVILGHTYVFVMSLSRNVAIFPDWMKRWSFQAVLGGFFAVDSFFLLSGLLATYLTMKEMQRKEGKLNWLMFYFHRIWRLTPAYMLIMLMYTGYFQYWSEGPFWIDHSPDHEQCTKYWWRNLLYIQNLFPITDECMAWSWYIANDMQFFVISPLILIPLYRKPLIGYVIFGLLFLEQLLFRGFMSANYELRMNIPQPDQMIDWFNYIYQRPYSRIGPYLVGMFVGYIMWKSNRKVHLPKLAVAVCICIFQPAVAVGWILSLLCVTSVVYGTLGENRGHVNSVTTDAVYNSLCKTVWSLGLAWIIFACNTGYGGIINSFLSSPLWGPLSRLTYCAYLLHPILIYVFVLSQRYPVYFTDLNVIYMFFGNWMMTYLVAFVVSMLFEAPMIGLEKIVFRRSR